MFPILKIQFCLLLLKDDDDVTGEKIKQRPSHLK